MFAMKQTNYGGTTKWFERQRAKQSWESTWDKFAWYSYEKGIYYVYSLPCVLYFRSVRVSQVMTLKLKDLIADPDSTGTNDESWDPRTKPKGHYEICNYTQYISHAYQSKLSKNNMLQFSLCDFSDGGAEEPHSSGEPRVISKSTTDSSRKCGALQEGKNIYTNFICLDRKLARASKWWLPLSMVLAGLYIKHKRVYTTWTSCRGWWI